MQRLFDRIAQQAESLRELGEELEARIDALREEASDEIEEVEWRVHHLENDLLRMRDNLRAPALEVARSARILAEQAAKSAGALRESVEKAIDGCCE